MSVNDSIANTHWKFRGILMRKIKTTVIFYVLLSVCHLLSISTQMIYSTAVTRFVSPTQRQLSTSATPARCWQTTWPRCSSSVDTPCRVYGRSSGQVTGLDSCMSIFLTFLFLYIWGSTLTKDTEGRCWFRQKLQSVCMIGVSRCGSSVSTNVQELVMLWCSHCS